MWRPHHVGCVLARPRVLGPLGHVAQTPRSRCVAGLGAQQHRGSREVYTVPEGDADQAGVRDRRDDRGNEVDNGRSATPVASVPGMEKRSVRRRELHQADPSAVPGDAHGPRTGGIRIR